MKKLIFAIALAAICQSAFASRECIETDGNHLHATLSSGMTEPFTIFMWVKDADFDGDYQHYADVHETTASQDHRVSINMRVADELRGEMRTTSNGGSVATWTADAANGIWVPTMFSLSGDSDRTMYAWVGGRESQQTTNTFALNAVDEMTICTRADRNSGTYSSAKVAHFTVWDGVALSGTQFDTLADTSGGNAANPTTIEGASIVAYYPLTDSSLSDESGNGGPTLTETGTVAVDTMDNPSVDAVSGGATGYSLLQQINQRQGAQQ